MLNIEHITNYRSYDLIIKRQSDTFFKTLPNYKFATTETSKGLLENGQFLSNDLLGMLEEKIYIPYMISKSTKIHFGDRISQINSFIDILKTFTSLKQ